MPDVAMSGVIALPAGSTIVEVVSGALLAAVIMTAVFFGRRFVVALGRARDAERFRSAVADLGTRIDATLGTLVFRVDAVRRRQLDATAIESELTAVVERLLGFTAEAEAIREPARETGVRPGFAASVRGELERAERAIRMIEYGCEVLTSGRGSFARSPDGETALKRGYLNLLHAREALAEDAAAWSGRQAVRKTPPRAIEPDHGELEHGAELIHRVGPTPGSEQPHAAEPTSRAEPVPLAEPTPPVEPTVAAEATPPAELMVAVEPTPPVESPVAAEPPPAADPGLREPDTAADGAAGAQGPSAPDTAGRRRATRRRQRTGPPIEPGDAGPG